MKTFFAEIWATISYIHEKNRGENLVLLFLKKINQSSRHVQVTTYYIGFQLWKILLKSWVSVHNAQFVELEICVAPVRYAKYCFFRPPVLTQSSSVVGKLNIF
jgi:hypothetical protein